MLVSPRKGKHYKLHPLCLLKVIQSIDLTYYQDTAAQRVM